jgi:hypothetical protein
LSIVIGERRELLTHDSAVFRIVSRFFTPLVVSPEQIPPGSSDKSIATARHVMFREARATMGALEEVAMTAESGNRQLVTLGVQSQSYEVPIECVVICRGGES